MSSKAQADQVLAAIEARQSIDARTLLLVAHPDDEVLGASIVLTLASKLHLAHATNGAPAGVGDQGKVSDARFAELDMALGILGAAPSQSTRFDFTDGTLVDHAAALSEALMPVVANSEVVITHAFEGGHPDHDACALALHLACQRVALSKGHHVAQLEFAIYARDGDRIVTNSFPADPAVVALTEAEKSRKGSALEAFRSQQSVIEHFKLHHESLRATPIHDFAEPREPGKTLFAAADPDRERRWREAAGALLRR
jgi:LmbE family N-acetylglucosaminyl deacetylase